jgi:hypothetical protein
MKVSTIGFLLMLASSFLAPGAHGQECSTVLECANFMAQKVSELQDANAALGKEVSELSVQISDLSSSTEKSLSAVNTSIANSSQLIDALGQIQVLAVVRIERGQIVNASDKRIAYDGASGRVTWPNDGGVPAVALVTQNGNEGLYNTVNEYICEQDGKTYAVVRGSPFDSRKINLPYFEVVVFGFHGGLSGTVPVRGTCPPANG